MVPRNQNEEFDLGPDRVVVSAGEVTIYTPRPMDGWEVREFCRIPIWFRDHKFFVRRKWQVEGARRYAYELGPWPDDLHEESPIKIKYDELYVALRDEAHRRDMGSELGRLVLLPFYPFLGFGWSRFKDRTLEPFGINPVSVTEASLMLSLGLFLLEAIFTFYLHQGYGQLLFGFSSLWWDGLALVILPLDAVVRYNQVLRGDEVPDGFLEWLLRRRRSSQS
jgi:hypothetical protein